ncbi:histidine kinase [Streptomyces sp. NBC_00669]|uniref:sensor histidine kinase n=1 Tax=Streptomyces sp. NBC_00669 TaxID=2976011 RepID=UPI002E31E52A|nr:ATP-binding protein [Streptomyces sp. NBC_00669]
MGRRPRPAPSAAAAGRTDLTATKAPTKAPTEAAAEGGLRIGWAAGLAALVLLPAVAGRPVALVTAVPAALAAFVLCLRVPWRRVAGVPAAASSAVCLASSAADLAFRGPKGYVVLWAVVELPALLLLLRRVARRAPERTALVTGPLLALAAVLMPLRLAAAEPPVAPHAVVLSCVLGLFPAGLAAGVGLYFRAVEARRGRAVVSALHAQRLQVAADLHDFVAHELTGIVVEVQSARWAGGLDEEETAELLARVEAAGMRALESMDLTLGSLREGVAPDRTCGLADLPALVGRFAAAGHGPRAELVLEPGLEDVLPRLSDDAAYRVVVEALTNVRRHAEGAAQVTVTVARTAGGVEVTVADDGRTVPARTGPRHGGGTGLAELTQRLETLGGSLTCGPHPTGWRVRALLAA